MDQRDIYRDHAREYDELVRAEDKDNALERTLAQVVCGANVIEVGAGTGRLSRVLLACGAASLLATERERAMLKLARESIVDDRVRFEIADALSLPAESDVYDVGIEGWVFGHFRHWLEDGWRVQLDAAIGELGRCVRPGGKIVLIETLGTGKSSPAPNAALAEMYAFLESERGFSRTEIRTDYEFPSEADARRVLGFFFGDERVKTMVTGAVVPECTGVWVRENR